MTTKSKTEPAVMKRTWKDSPSHAVDLMLKFTWPDGAWVKLHAGGDRRTPEQWRHVAQILLDLADGAEGVDR